MKILYSDLDNTIIFNRKVNETDYEVLKSFFRKKDTQFIIVTGRGRGIFFEAIDRCNLFFDYAILSGGGLIIDRDHNVIYEKPIDINVAKEILNSISNYVEHNIEIIVNTNKTTYEYEDIDLFKQNFIKEYKAESIISFSIGNKDGNINIKKYEEIFKDVDNIEIHKNNNYIDLTYPNVSKETAIIVFEKIIKNQGIKLYETYSIGDAENDIPMFRATKISCTFHDSDENVKNEAKICVNSISEYIMQIENEEI